MLVLKACTPRSVRDQPFTSPVTFASATKERMELITLLATVIPPKSMFNLRAQGGHTGGIWVSSLICAKLYPISSIPAANSHPSPVTCFTIVSHNKWFVNKSETLSAPFTLLYGISFRANFCCTHRTDVDVCLVLPKPCLFTMPNAALASAIMRQPAVTPQSLRLETKPITSALHLTPT